jgi:hypothetical protein
VALFLFLALCMAPLLALASPGRALAAEPAGVVATLKGKGYVVRTGSLGPIAVGDHFYQGDTLVTSEQGTMGVTFRDDTTMALGPGSKVRIDEYVFAPADGQLGFAAHMQSGTAQFISGQMAKLAPEKMSFSTNLMTVGIRGTRFLIDAGQEGK